MTTPDHPTPPPSPAADRVEALKRLFPGAVRDGELDMAALSALIDPERTGDTAFGLQWPGRREALQLWHRAARTALVHDPDASRPGTGGNLLLEGDNLEVLKLLRKAYAGRVKAIFVDPPYNTGRDFVYKDDYSDPLDAYLAQTGQVDGEGRRTASDLEKNGRKHSGWLTMMYPRLLLAEELLSDDGVFFMTLDSTEVAHARLLLDEVFGEEGFVAQVTWKRKSNPQNKRQVKIGTVSDYILVYAKNLTDASLGRPDMAPHVRKKYRNPDNDPRGPWKMEDLSAGGKGGRLTADLVYPITNPSTGEKHYPEEGRQWIVNATDAARHIESGSIVFSKGGKGRPYIKAYLSDKAGMPASDIWLDLGQKISAETARVFRDARAAGKRLHELAGKVDTADWTKAQRSSWQRLLELLDEEALGVREDALDSEFQVPWYLVGNNSTAGDHLESVDATLTADFETPKPIELLEFIVQIATRTDENHIVLDFFAGSGTTAEAVLRANARDGGNRRFICVQLPEPAKSKRFTDLFDVLVARVNGALDGNGQDGLALSGGFDVWRQAPSHVKAWAGYDGDDPEELLIAFEQMTTRLVDGATLEDLAWELALTDGLGLDASLDLRDVGGVQVAVVTDERAGRTIHVTLDRPQLATVSDLGLGRQDWLYVPDDRLDDEAKKNLRLRCNLRTL